ncbi:hypothetical protein HDV06_002194 [Boothiomyces sp. JEL0866]|nr:hypothetical protein HDV06_002194 [Boothiomyces sp. JEL0866]
MQRIKVNLKRPQPLKQISQVSASPFATFSTIVDPTGKLNFEGKASLGKDGIQFANGTLYNIKLEDFETISKLGQGQFGIVQKVRHKPTDVIMALKEIRLELDQNKLNHIIMELEVLHKSKHPNIIEFYGAFVVESCVYMSIEYMDAGSFDKLYQGGIPEPVLAKVATAMVEGLTYLKNELKVIHRDVKPTNVLVNTKGQPERITSGGGDYSSKSDVWSLGLSIIEMAAGQYPFSSTASESVFAQLNAIVAGPAPTLPAGFSQLAHDFIAACLQKEPVDRPNYPMLLEMEWITFNRNIKVDMVGWVQSALQKRK